MKKLKQQLYTKLHPATAIDIDYFLELLSREEDFFQPEQHKTKLMLSRLRKIFYDKYGWDTQLIRKAANIEGRYEVKLVPADQLSAHKKCTKHTSNGPDYQRREVIVKPGDWMNPNAGSTPEMYADNHQQVILRDGSICDIGHTLAGMDAANNPLPVALLPTKLLFLHPLVPHVDKNSDAATWIGDLSSVSGEIFFHYREHKKWPTEEEAQNILDNGNPGPDMLGNMDSLCIGQLYDINTQDGVRISQILCEYYSKINIEPKLRLKLFCKAVGLKINEQGQINNTRQWIRFYARELKACTAFYIASRYSKPWAYWYAFIIWLGVHRKKLRYRELLQIQIDAIESSYSASENKSGKRQTPTERKEGTLTSEMTSMKDQN